MEEMSDGIEIEHVLRQTAELILRLGIDVSNAGHASTGSDRFKSIFHAYLQLNELHQRAKRDAAFRQLWDGSNGEYLMARLDEIDKRLKQLNEGPTTGLHQLADEAQG